MGLRKEDQDLALQGQLPILHGVKASQIPFGGGVVYSNLALPVPFSGNLLLTDGFIQGLYVHMGFHPAWKYEVVHELVFDRGLLIKEYDRSATMAEVRQQLLAQPLQPDLQADNQSVRRWIETSFSLDY